MAILGSVGLFVLAGFCEIGGGYLIWLWMCEGKPITYAVAGAVILVLYGVIPTLQPAHFSRVYAAYGVGLSPCHCSGDGGSIVFRRIAMT